MVSTNTDRTDFPGHLYNRNTIWPLTHQITKENYKVTWTVFAFSEKVLEFVYTAMDIANSYYTWMSLFCFFCDSMNQSEAQCPMIWCIRRILCRIIPEHSVVTSPKKHVILMIDGTSWHAEGTIGVFSFKSLNLVV